MVKLTPMQAKAQFDQDVLRYRTLIYRIGLQRDEHVLAHARTLASLADGMKLYARDDGSPLFKAAIEAKTMEYAHQCEAEYQTKVELNRDLDESQLVLARIRLHGATGWAGVGANQ
jgi:hypothetical protein